MQSNLHEVEIFIVSSPIVLKKASIGAIPNTNKKWFCVRAKRYTRDLPKKIDLLLLLKPTLCIKDMHKVSWLSHCHESPIRCEPYRTYSSKVALKNSNRLWQVPNIPNTACFVLVTSSKNMAIRMPCRCKWVIQVSR